MFIVQEAQVSEISIKAKLGLPPKFIELMTLEIFYQVLLDPGRKEKSLNEMSFLLPLFPFLVWQNIHILII